MLVGFDAETRRVAAPLRLPRATCNVNSPLPIFPRASAHSSVLPMSFFDRFSSYGKGLRKSVRLKHWNNLPVHPEYSMRSFVNERLTS
jgi:hypothetical protein